MRTAIRSGGASISGHRRKSVLPKHLLSSAEDGQRERLIIDPWQEKARNHLGAGFIASEEVDETLGVPTAQRNPERFAADRWNSTGWALSGPAAAQTPAGVPGHQRAS